MLCVYGLSGVQRSLFFSAMNLLINTPRGPCRTCHVIQAEKYWSGFQIPLLFNIEEYNGKIMLLLLYLHIY